MKKENGKGDEPMASNYIRFDWAMKRLLRNKANFAVLEGFLTTLLNEKIVIQKLLESEGIKKMSLISIIVLICLRRTLKESLF